MTMDQGSRPAVRIIRNRSRALTLLACVTAAALLGDVSRLLLESALSSPVQAAAVPEVDRSPAAPSEHVPAQAVAPHSVEDHSGNHTDPVAPVLAGIVIILLVAKIGGDLFERIGMPAVLGELTVGVLLGNMAFLSGWHGLDFLHPPAAIDVRQKVTEIEQIAESTDLDHAERQSRIAAIESEIDDYQPYNTGAILKMLAGIGVILLLFEVGLESTIR